MVRRGRPVITMSKLGRWGRFANQVFQYAFLRLYAKKNGFRIQTASWIGQYLFGHKDSSVSLKLTRLNDGFHFDGHTSEIAGNPYPPKYIDVLGYFQYQTKFYAPDKEFFRSLFVPTPIVKRIVNKTIYTLKSKGNTVIGLHLRRGDYDVSTAKLQKAGGYFFVAPCEWYLSWLEENWNRLDKPVLFIASDEMHKVKDNFAKYNPITNEDLGVVLPKAPFYPDFYTLSKCNIMHISNSSFSFAASMLNENCTEFYRPRWSLKKLIPYDPWDAHTIFRDENY